MDKPKKEYYRIGEVADLWGLSELDILDYAEQGEINITVYLNEGKRCSLIKRGMGIEENVGVAKYCHLDKYDIRAYVHSGCGSHFKIYHGIHPIEANIWCQNDFDDEDIVIAKPVDSFDIPINTLLVSNIEKERFEKVHKAEAQKQEDQAAKAKTTEELLEIAESIKADGRAKVLSDKEIVQNIDATECKLTDAQIGKMFGNYNKDQHEAARKRGRRLRGKST